MQANCLWKRCIGEYMKPQKLNSNRRKAVGSQNKVKVSFRCTSTSCNMGSTRLRSLDGFSTSTMKCICSLRVAISTPYKTSWPNMGTVTSAKFPKLISDSNPWKKWAEISGPTNKVIFGPNKFIVNTLPSLVCRSAIVTPKPLLKIEGKRARTFTTGGSGLVGNRWTLLFHLEIFVATAVMKKIAMANQVALVASMSVMLWLVVM